MPEPRLRSRQGRIFDVQRFSIHDGPGIRTTVFLKGCPLRCIWCHNPEGAAPGPMLSFLPELCIGCGYCFQICPREAHTIEDDVHELDRAVCEVCGACAEECYAQALELIGRDVTVEEVMGEVLRDRPFYETSGGGITLSGGDPTFQMDFTEALLRVAREEGLNTCVETSGFTNCANLPRIEELVDLFLYDIKETDPQRHQDCTGVSNELILANLRALHARGARILLRCPIIPGYNDRADHFEALATLAVELPDLVGLEVMPYHALGESKALRLGLDPEGRAVSQPPAPEQIAEWTQFLRDRGAPVINEAPGTQA